jgi:hypothetical protein
MDKNRFEQLVDMIKVAIEVDTIGLDKASRAEQVMTLVQRVCIAIKEWAQEYYKEVADDRD